MSKLERLLRCIDKSSEITGKISSFLILIIVLTLVAEVILRYGFNRPTIWIHETSGFLFGAMSILAGGYVLLQKGHISVDVITSRLPLKIRLVLDLVAGFLFFLFTYYFLRETWKIALFSLSIREETYSFWHPPIYPFKLTIAVGGVVLFLQGLANFVRDVVKFVIELRKS